MCKTLRVGKEKPWCDPELKEGQSGWCSVTGDEGGQTGRTIEAS